jgi:hypothetical protein
MIAVLLAYSGCLRGRFLGALRTLSLQAASSKALIGATSRLSSFYCFTELLCAFALSELCARSANRGWGWHNCVVSPDVSAFGSLSSASRAGSVALLLVPLSVDLPYLTNTLRGSRRMRALRGDHC